ncbi:hypothetical protein Pst134EB_021602 [Puccinia striiformis f. sp. tritici]|nr:hypothetical protein Pst134EB_021602 [Puccinia striiformis f. sp. tritici]
MFRLHFRMVNGQPPPLLRPVTSHWPSLRKSTPLGDQILVHVPFFFFPLHSLCPLANNPAKLRPSTTQVDKLRPNRGSRHQYVGRFTQTIPSEELKASKSSQPER